MRAIELRNKNRSGELKKQQNGAWRLLFLDVTEAPRSTAIIHGTRSFVGVAILGLWGRFSTCLRSRGRLENLPQDWLIAGLFQADYPLRGARRIIPSTCLSWNGPWSRRWLYLPSRRRLFPCPM